MGLLKGGQKKEKKVAAGEREGLRTDSSLKLLPTRLLKRLDVKRVGGRLTWDVQLRKEVQSE